MEQERPIVPKRLIVCCDGSWMDSLGSKGVEPQSNVSRMARVIRRTCHDGRHQVISYDAGVGTGVLKLDQYTGGGFGMGLSENVREAYNFLCANYVDGDEMILVGFSRGAFTARSVADMVATLGLLTPEGLQCFYRIFEDYQHLASRKRPLKDFMCPAGCLEPWDGKEDKKAWAARRRKAYGNWLAQAHYARSEHLKQDGEETAKSIHIKAIAVWDTVGSLGIPPVSVLGLYGSALQWQFSGVEISSKVDYAFQALALDEPRDAFKPALWEKAPDNHNTKLKQVWFPGSHSGVGGGYHDQQMANITLAWMCDQLSNSCGVEFSYKRLEETFAEGMRYSVAHPFPMVPLTTLQKWTPSFLSSVKPPLPWAHKDIFADAVPPGRRDTADCSGVACREERHPRGFPDTPPDGMTAPDPKWDAALLARPWALGLISHPSRVQSLLGNSARRPGRFVHVDPETNQPTGTPLVDTHERVHSSVRVRLACGGLALDDAAVWPCEGLLGEAPDLDARKVKWRLERRAGPVVDDASAAAPFSPRELRLPDYPPDKMYPLREGDGRFCWVLTAADGGKAEAKPSVRRVTELPEEPLVGYWERYLLAQTTGKADVWRFAQEKPPL